MSSNLLAFDDPPRARAANAALADGDAPHTIAATLRAAGIDAPCSLYNEALALAREGHLGQANARLQMLIGLDPDDDDALLLLAKVHAAQGRPQEALARLDGAVAAGAVPPAGLRDFLEETIRAERVREEEARARSVSRDQSEVKALRAEARHLRSETVRLETELLEVQDREQRWKIGALSAAAIGAALVLTIVIFGASEPGVAEAPVAAVAREAASAPTAGQAPSEALVATAPGAAAPVAAPAAPAEPVAPVGGGRVHVVASGDTLYKLASRYYGDASQWEKIQTANRQKLGSGIALSLGQELVIP